MSQTTLAKNLTNLRLSNNLSEDEITRISGKSWVSWCKYESGEAKPPKTVLDRISRYFKVPVEEILGDTSLPKRKSPSRTTAQTVKENGKAKVQEEIVSAPKEEEKTPPVELFIQSSDGREISLNALYNTLKNVAPNAENVYVKPEDNRAYWTAPRGQKGSFELY